MTVPETPTPTPAAKRPPLVDRLKAALVWVLSTEGRKDVGAVIAAATAVYTALHRAGV